MYYAYRLNKQWQYTALTYFFHNFEPVHFSMSDYNCGFLACIQVSQKAGNMFWYSYLFKDFTQFVVIYTVKGVSIVSKAEVGDFLKFSCFSYDPMNVGNLISGSSAFYISNLYIWTFSVHVLLKPSLKDCEHCLACMWNECNCAVVWTFFGISPFWDWNENWLSYSTVATADLSKFPAILNAAL